MKKNSITGAILFALAFCIATGVDENPIQAAYSLVLMGGSLLCSKKAKRMEQKESSERTIGGVMRDAA